MIPRTLRLKNFLSYGNKEEVVDFGAYPLICLNGKNGHGKSALLDAMTWALWGQARKTSSTSKPDSHLLHLGQTFMAVSFDFMFNSHLYRVRREHAKTYGDAHAALDFGIVNEATGHITSLTDKTIKKTQDKIISTIGLDYDAFINTAFLRQGQANEFSKKSPKDRKDLLATILHLDQFDEIKKRAAEKQKELLASCTHMTQWNERIQQELQNSAHVNQQLLVIKEQIQTHTDQEQKVKDAIHTIQKSRDGALSKKAQVEKDKLLLEERLKARDEITLHVRNTYASWKSGHKMFLNAPSTQQLQERKEALLHAINQHQKLLQHNLIGKEQQLTTMHQQEAVRKQIEDALNTKILEQKTRAQNIALQANTTQQHHKQITGLVRGYEEDIRQFDRERSTLELQKQQLLKQLTAFDVFYAQFEKRKTMYHTWVARLKMIDHEIEELKRKQWWVAHEENPSCPLCEQNLSAARKRFLKTKFSKIDHQHLHRKKRLSTVLKTLKSLLIEQNGQLEHLRALHSKVEQLTLQQASLAKMSEKTQELCRQQDLLLTQAEQKIKELMQQHEREEKEYHALAASLPTLLQNDPEYHKIQETLKKLERDIKEHQYDQDAHQKTQKELADVQQYELFLLQAQQQALEQTKRKEEIQLLLSKLRGLKKDAAELAQLQEKEQTYMHEYDSICKELKALEESYEQLLKDRETRAQEQGKLQEQQLKLVQLEKEQQEYLQKIASLRLQADEYQIIATAMGKDGIQALLIEDALPEIEHEANLLLGELTDNQAHIIIESLRDLKKGGTKETLDIKISDPAGIRPYEMFSGGEAFRIDFALRIAISKLLARRAGTSLQTLIIDEGFGSQDEEGLAHITQALHKIQDHFKKIIIVSHLTAMKDQFPVHFYVEKRGNASHVQVIEQD
jgi:exonuclease SbcC